MIISFVLKDSICDCKMKISDSHGEREYRIPAFCGDEDSSSFITAEIFDDAFSLSLVPVSANVKLAMDNFDTSNLMDKLAKKVTVLSANSLDKMLLRVGCTYLIAGLQEGDRLDITLQSYAFGTFDRLDLLELFPRLRQKVKLIRLNILLPAECAACA